MTVDSIPLDELPEPTDPTRRDRWDRYLVVPPQGGKPVGYTRVTTVAKTLDGEGALGPWKAAMAMNGLIMRRGLRARWEALLAEGNPWYGSKEAKKEAKRLVEECAAAGGADDRRHVGNAMHAITALVDLGKTPQNLTDETARDIEAYTDGLTQAGITIVPGQVELVTVLDSVQVAGTFDRLANVPGFDLPLIADLKTGANLTYSWNAIAVQLAAYAHGEALYRQGPAKDGSKDQRLPMPEVDQSWGLIMHLNVDEHGSAKLELYLVDLQAGWAAFEHSLWTRDWRKIDPSMPFVPGMPRPLPLPYDGDLVPILAASIEAVEARKADSQLSTPSPPRTLREWLQGRIDDIGEHEHARATLIHDWPPGFPTLRGSDEHTPEQLAVIESLLDDIERRWTLGFPVARPETTHDEAVANVVSMFPGTTISNNETEQEQ